MGHACADRFSYQIIVPESIRRRCESSLFNMAILCIQGGRRGGGHEGAITLMVECLNSNLLFSSCRIPLHTLLQFHGRLSQGAQVGIPFVHLRGNKITKGVKKIELSLDCSSIPEQFKISISNCYKTGSRIANSGRVFDVHT